jgi:5-methylcytosine-specific restriction enzyme A
VLVFTGSTGERHGYVDGFQPDGTFWYTGEGQHADMQLVRGNLTLTTAEQEGGWRILRARRTARLE